MTLRRQIITAVTTGTLTQAQAARAYGVSPSMVSKLLRQWAREGTAAYYTKCTHTDASSARSGLMSLMRSRIIVSQMECSI